MPRQGWGKTYDRKNPERREITEAQRVLQQQLVATDLNLGTAANEDTGTSGHTLPFLDGNNTWSGSNVYPTVVLTDQTSAPSAPSSGFKTLFPWTSGHLFYETSAGRLILLANPQAKRIAAAAGNNSTTSNLFGIAALTTDGTATAVAAANTNYYTKQPRQFAASAASTGSDCGYRHASVIYLGLAGSVVIRFGWEAFQTNAAAFVGLRASAAHGNGDPTAFTDAIGLFLNSGQTTWRVGSNDGSGSATVVDLGANFPANSSATDFYEFTLWWGDSPSAVYYQLVRNGGTHIAKGSISSDVASLTTGYAMSVLANTRSGSSVLSIAYSQLLADVL